MSLRKSALAAAAALSIVAVPTVAQASAASKLSLRAAPAVTAVSRAGAARGESDIGGGSVIIAILAAVAVVVGIVIAADGSDSPSSP
jgi:hypothetical protein